MTDREMHPKVAISAEFLSAFAGIPKKQQGKVLEFLDKFRENPASPGINYEKIHKARDPSLRSVRIDQAYRGIVLKPTAGNVYVLLWVDHHDEAYAWAENRICRIHPETGSLQVLESRSLPAVEDLTPRKAAAQPAPEGLFAAIRDRQLLALGIPEILLPLVRGIGNEDDLDAAAQQLPEEAFDALLLLAAGYSPEEVFQELDRSAQPQAIDTADYAAALETPDSRRRFYVVEDELELASILNAPLEKWRVFLHPSQRRLVERDWNGPVRVLGGAGTGKTVAAMHRAAWLARHRFSGDNDRLLFTTFTRNLAADIHANLRKICPDDAMSRIEVVNLDRWVFNFLRRSGYGYEIDYGQRTKPLWEKALALAPVELALHSSFYREEWEAVIQPQGITALADYLKVPRTGRGVRLNRPARKAVWPVFEEYRLLLEEHRLREPDDAMRDARQLLQSKGAVLPYRAIVVDEAQDMGPQAFHLIREMVPGGPNDLFIVGDTHQRIYRHKVVLGRCGIDIRGRSRKLRINYRTTEENRRWAVNLLEGLSIDDLDGALDDQKDYKSLLHGIVPEVRRFRTFPEEIEFIVRYLRRLEAGDGSLKETCLVTRTHDLLKQYQNAFNERGLETCFIHRSEAEDRNAPGVRLATMHRVKGLEFDRVVIAAVNEGVVPLEAAVQGSSDTVVQRESEIRERALLYVAATRARKEVMVTSSGKSSSLLAFEE